MNQLTFVIACKGRLSFLQRSLPSVIRLPDVRCVVVDYDCPQKCGAWVEATYPQVRVVRVAQRPSFYLAEARNLGAKVVDTPWICFTDADIVFEPAFADAVPPLLGPNVYLRAPRSPGTAGTVICARTDFDRVGGYDEAMKGWGYDDCDFYEMLQDFQVQEATLPAGLLSHIDHDDRVRAEFHENKNVVYTWVTNRLYSYLKHALMKEGYQTLSLSSRQRLYDWAMQAHAQFAAGQPVQYLQVELNNQSLGPDCPFVLKKAVGFSLGKGPDRAPGAG